MDQTKRPLNTFLVRESSGTYCLDDKLEEWKGFSGEKEECRFATLSPNKKYIAIGNSSTVNIYLTSSGALHCLIRHRVLRAQFSPLGNFLVSWDNPNRDLDNYIIWSLNGSNDKKGVIVPSKIYCSKYSKIPESSFSGNELSFGRLYNSEIKFFNSTDFIHHTQKLEGKVGNFSFSPAKDNPLFIVFIPGDKTGSPSFTSLYKFPCLTKICSRSSHQAERVDFKWNSRGNAVLVSTMTDIDKTGGSYYGKSSLQYLDSKGESYLVQLIGDGCDIVHCAKWSPSSHFYCVIVGRMPKTRTALINLKGDLIFEMEGGARNEIFFNPLGNLVLICGLGNLPGTIEVWEVKDVNKKITEVKDHNKKITEFKVPNTTQIEWLEDGAHFITATTAPRLNVDNGFKIWDFTGKEIKSWKAQKHLFSIIPLFESETDKKDNFPHEKLDAIIEKLGNVKANSTKKVEDKKKEGLYIPAHRRKDQNSGASSGALSKKTEEKKSIFANPNAKVLTETEKKIKNVERKLEQIKNLKEIKKEGTKALEKNQEEKILTEASLLAELKELHLSNK